MSRKHYIQVAKIVNANYEAAKAADGTCPAVGGDCHRALVRQVAYDLARYFHSDNPRFQPGTFLAACGIPN